MATVSSSLHYFPFPFSLSESVVPFSQLALLDLYKSLTWAFPLDLQSHSCKCDSVCILSSFNLLTSNQFIHRIQKPCKVIFPPAPSIIWSVCYWPWRPHCLKPAERYLSFPCISAVWAHLFPELMPHPQVHSLLRLFFILYKTGIWISFNCFIWQILFLSL